MIEWQGWLAVFSEFVAGLTTLLNSNFSAALFGSLAGALGGAWAAQRIAEKSKVRDLLLKEINRANAAATILNSVANTHIGMKKQHIKKLRDDFEEERAQFLLFLKAQELGTVPPRQVYNF